MKKTLLRSLFVLAFGILLIPTKAFSYPQYEIAICDNFIECGYIPTNPHCGNGNVEGSEECDGDPSVCPVAGSTCSSSCTCEPPPPPPVCGDGTVNLGGEECDGADLSGCSVAGSTCSPLCQCVPPQPVPVCGDGSVNQGGEECDGADLSGCIVAGSTCSSTCACIPPAPPPTTTVDVTPVETNAVGGNGIYAIAEGSTRCSFNPAATSGFSGEALILGFGLLPLIGRRFRKTQ